MSNYQVLSEKLQQILTELQSGEIELDVAIQKYEEAAEIIKELEKHLKHAKNKVQKIQSNS